jgi:hypothetical protein
MDFPTIPLPLLSFSWVFFILLTLIPQMTNTRNRNNNNAGDNNGENSQNEQAAQPQAPPRDSLGDFQRTKSPTFSHAVEPMDADDLLKSVEKKLQVVRCNNREKVLLASHQLSCLAADWWDAYVEAHEEPKSINWPEFRAAFRAHHVP